MASPQAKKHKNPLGDIKTSVTCTNMPESLFDAVAAKRHFSKFGRVTKILLRPKRQMCIIEYDTPIAAERAVLNAGAYDGFMFDVTRTKQRSRKRSKKEEDPDWLPDSDVEEELSAMSGAPMQRISRQKSMDVDKAIEVNKTVKKIPVRKKEVVREKQIVTFPASSGTESPVPSTIMASTLNTSDAAMELHQLRSRIANTPDEQWRLLDARDKILRAWGGTGARVKVGGATIGTCSDMCPEKERLHRQAEHQVMTLEAVPNSDGRMDVTRAVKQYSRSSADQEIPMCYELRPPRALLMTCSYLLNEIADTDREVSLADWFHFMWDRFRGIRKDITQQALCCADSIRLVETCARFHAHCAARLADLEHTQFDQKLNTDNLTKCLQTLKHMYADVSLENKPNEAEFRGYIALLNLGDANFWWEIKSLPQEIQKSESIVFAIQVFNALDNNNYVRFFRLIKERATYLQACILLRYFNDVRARALARIVKAFAPRGGSRYPAYELMEYLAFESVESMKCFIAHYGLRFGKVDDGELAVILDRHQFIEDSDPYPIARAKFLIESKRRHSVGETIAGGTLPEKCYLNHEIHTSFNTNGTLKEYALLAADQNYNTLNDSNKNIMSLKAEVAKLKSDKSNVYNIRNSIETKSTITKFISNPTPVFTTLKDENEDESAIANLFSFNLPIKMTPQDILASRIKMNDNTSFVFSLPQKVSKPVLDKINQAKSLSDSSLVGNLVHSKFHSKLSSSESKKGEKTNMFSGNGPFATNSLLDSSHNKKQNNKVTDNNTISKIFSVAANEMLRNENDNKSKQFNIFAERPQDEKDISKSIFGNALKKMTVPVNGMDSYSIFSSKNKIEQPSVAASIFKSAKPLNADVYEFDNKLEDEQERQIREQQEFEEQKFAELRYLEEQRKLEELKREEMRLQELRRLEEEKTLQEEKRKREELRRLEEKRKQEEREKEELKKRLEEKRITEERKRKEEEEKRFLDRVNKESDELLEELLSEINLEALTESLKVALEDMKQMTDYATSVRDETVEEVCNEICKMEMKAELFLTRKLMTKWMNIWRLHCIRNRKRRNLLDETPVWLPDHSPEQEAKYLKRQVERSVLQNMKAIRRGYKFKGELKTLPTPQQYKVVDIIRTSLLKRMRRINYPCDKCFFWKITLVIESANTWINRKLELKPLLLSLFSDNEPHESDCLIQVQKYSWKNLMDVAISVSLADDQNQASISEAVDGTNALLFYMNENDKSIMNRIENILRHEFLYQIVPLIVITSCKNPSVIACLQNQFADYVNQKRISKYKLYIVGEENTFKSVKNLTKTSLKWLVQNYPPVPSLEIDLVKSICQRYLGTEIWCRLKVERTTRLGTVLRDPNKLIRIYNVAVDRLTEIITDENLFNYPPFPLEFKKYCNHTTPYPKPYEFVTNDIKSVENVTKIKDIMRRLKLVQSPSEFRAFDVESMQEQIRDYCNQIGWFENPESVVCKVVATMSNECSDLDISGEQDSHIDENYDIIDVLNIIVCEKINSFNEFQNLLAVYDKSVLENYRTSQWWYEMDIVRKRKHRTEANEDDIDHLIAAKRRKLSESMYGHLTLEDKDTTVVEQSIESFDKSISKIQCHNKTVKELERKIEEQRQKSVELENLLRTALRNV